MQVLTINIGGKLFKIACDEGEGPRILSAGRVIDELFTEFKKHSNNASHELLLVMCALQLQDKVLGLETKISRLTGQSPSEIDEEQLAETLSTIAVYLENLASKVKK